MYIYQHFLLHSSFPKAVLARVYMKLWETLKRTRDSSPVRATRETAETLSTIVPHKLTFVAVTLAAEGRKHARIPVTPWIAAVAALTLTTNPFPMVPRIPVPFLPHIVLRNPTQSSATGGRTSSIGLLPSPLFCPTAAHHRLLWTECRARQSSPVEAHGLKS